MIEQLIEQLKAHKFDTTAKVEIVQMVDPTMAAMVYDGIVIERGYRTLKGEYSTPAEMPYLLEDVLAECIYEIQNDLWKYIVANRYIYALHRVVERSGMSPHTYTFCIKYGILYGKYCN